MRFTVRIDVAHTYEVEADSEDEAQEAAQDRYEDDDMGDDSRITETLVFDKEEA